MPSDTNNILNNTNLNPASPYHIPRCLIGDDDNIQSLIKIVQISGKQKQLENLHRRLTNFLRPNETTNNIRGFQMDRSFTSYPSPPITYNGSTTFNYRLNIISTYQKITNKLLSDRKILTINNHHIWRLIKTLNRHQVYQSQIYQNQSTLHPKIIPSALMTPIWDNMIEIQPPNHGRLHVQFIFTQSTIRTDLQNFSSQDITGISPKFGKLTTQQRTFAVNTNINPFLSH
ncbi:hypothetical protein RhiirC2_794115 [Rhizophagus irregularis]|uniref:Uncharacterized protein n=1 Tax=Rhizophagus irregularis TaxID=588596 RepID=A0A2N1ME50_9GLOM|nr:hypothetical protein RhiirC2_794115 [Rhizophagus irregularis]